MENELVQCLTEITVIKKYLVKKGKSRFQGKVIQSKLSEAESIFQRGNSIISIISQEKNIQPELLSSYLSIWDNIKTVYKKILLLCEQPIEESSESDSSYSEASEYSDFKMEFDLKTACSLIPVLDGDEKSR